MTGHLHDARGHRHLGGMLGPSMLGEHRERHVAAISFIVTALIAAYSAYATSQAQTAAADYQKRVAEQQQNAALQAGTLAEQNQRDQNRRQQAALRARIGMSGAVEDVGAPLMAVEESARNAELNARAIRWGTETRAAGFHAEAVGQGFAGLLARRQGYVGAGASILTGLGKAYATYRSNQPSSTPGSIGYQFDYQPGAGGYYA
jgi:hypothetical protein